MATSATSTSFKKGQSGNPNGRPKREWTWSGVLEKAVQEEINGIAVKEAVAKSLIREALKGNVVAAKELMNRMDGMPSQDITSDGEAIQGPIVYLPKEEE